MKIICSSSGFINPVRPRQGISDILKAGFGSISLDLDACCSSMELEQYGKLRKDNEEWRYMENYEYLPISEHPTKVGCFFERLLAECQSRNLQISVAHAPYLSRDTKRTDLREVLFDLYKESIRFCGQIGCKYIVIRPFCTSSVKGSAASYESVRMSNFEYYLRLAAVARENQVMILLENQCHSLNGHLVRGVCSDSFEAVEWVDTLNDRAGEERFGFCLDVGVCTLCGQDMHEFTVTLGKRIKAVILRDCDGQHESSLLPFTSVCMGQPQTDWLCMIRGLREIGFDGQLILDIRDTAGVFSPLLRPPLLMFAKAVADYFKWQIEIENLLRKYSFIVLFGAGNMCRNYMKCYGEKYPPLFTSDNNRKMWGENFCGLEVKSPEELKRIPDGCGVFICNIYYHEIEEQLRDMGVKNIEFFNDEYMPSFYFDRLKMV